MTPVVPLGRHASKTPIFSQRYTSIRGLPRASRTVQLHIKPWDMSNIEFYVGYLAIVNVHYGDTDEALIGRVGGIILACDTALITRHAIVQAIYTC